MNKLQVLALALLVLSVPLPAFAVCGDGIRDGADACDDGNTVGGDGCSATCMEEAGFSCRTQPHVDIVNPSFEMDPFSSPGGLTGGGWTRLSVEDVDWVGGACWPAGDGSFSIDMNGSDRQGTMFQTLTTVAGQHYVLTFLGNANPADGTASTTCDSAAAKDLTVRVADGTDYRTATQARVLTLTRRMNLRDDWNLYTYEFDARSTVTTLVFEGSARSFNGPMIDRLAIPESVCTPTSCGDGTLSGTEQCDDGNRVAGDGCSASCITEPGYVCATAGARCTAASCGDGIVAGSETCDDKNTTPDDGCSATCTVEPGWSCVYVGTMAQSICTRSCGNGTLDPGEVCDDGNTVGQDACSNTCLRGPGEMCMADADCVFAPCAVPPGGTMPVCSGCYDTQPPNHATAADFGCTVAQPACDTTRMPPLCFICLTDDDCPASTGVPLFCNLTARACMPRLDVDSGRPDVGPPPIDASLPDVGPPPFDVGPPPADAGRDAAMAADAGAMDGATVDGGPRIGGASGGACLCSMHARTGGTAWRALLAIGAVALVLRRRARR